MGWGGRGWGGARGGAVAVFLVVVVVGGGAANQCGAESPSRCTLMGRTPHGIALMLVDTTYPMMSTDPFVLSSTGAKAIRHAASVRHCRTTLAAVIMPCVGSGTTAVRVLLIRAELECRWCPCAFYPPMHCP